MKATKAVQLVAQAFENIADNIDCWDSIEGRLGEAVKSLRLAAKDLREELQNDGEG